jgi:hypothetical protein
MSLSPAPAADQGFWRETHPAHLLLWALMHCLLLLLLPQLHPLHLDLLLVAVLMRWGSGLLVQQDLEHHRCWTAEALLTTNPARRSEGRHTLLVTDNHGLRVTNMA